MFLPNEYTIYAHGKELQREADQAALVRLVREDSTTPLTRWLNRTFAAFRRPQIALPQTQPETRQTATLRRV